MEKTSINGLRMKRLAGAKTLNYESSPLRRDMPQ